MSRDRTHQSLTVMLYPILLLLLRSSISCAFYSLTINLLFMSCSHFTIFGLFSVLGCHAVILVEKTSLVDMLGLFRLFSVTF